MVGIGRATVRAVQRRRPVTLVGMVIVACGVVMVVVGWCSNATSPAGDANIGAGALVLGGMLVVLVGLVVWAAQGVVARRRAARDERR
jgi:drug/metabolite transporter (DMT)-like permease